MTRFRPCIDLHHGQVKQIVGGSLSAEETTLKTNFVSEKDASFYAELYQKDALQGGHVIMLGKGNEEVAKDALLAYPKGLQVGGGIDDTNALTWLEAGASHVIVTSYLFESDGTFSWRKLEEIAQKVGKKHLVLDLSCRRTKKGWQVAMNRWQTLTNLEITLPNLDKLLPYCDEFLIHAADVEGLCQGIDEELVTLLGHWRQAPMTYAGGIAHLEDFETIERLSEGSMDATVGSALDLFGGNNIRYQDLLAFNQRVPL